MTNRMMMGIALGLALAACSKAEPRSQQYFAAHIDEARKLVSACRDGSERGEECTNADMTGPHRVVRADC